MSRTYHGVDHVTLVRATRTILKFSVDHHGGTQHFAAVLKALERDDFPAALKEFKSRPGGPYTWADWFPPVAFPHEDADYNWEVFEAISERWCRLMLTAAGEWKWLNGHPLAKPK
jgi:hypothetical protein